jgi:hypothetical protein
VDKAARRYARWVLTAHLVLLAIVLLIVGLAVRTLYRGARTQALQQAMQTQELLARQTALGIQNYYETVSAVLQLIQPDENIPPPTAPAQPRRGSEAREQARRRALESVPFTRFTNSIWESLRSHANLLFVVDSTGRHERRESHRRRAGRAAAAEDHRRRRPVDRLRQARVGQQVPQASGHERRRRAPRLCADARPGGLVMVAVVPVSALEKDMLRNVNRSPSTGAMLVDHSGTFVSSSEPQAVGHKYTELKNSRTRKLAEQYVALGRAGTEIFDHSEQNRRRNAQAGHVHDSADQRARAAVVPRDLLGPGRS